MVIFLLFVCVLCCLREDNVIDRLAHYDCIRNRGIVLTNSQSHHHKAKNPTSSSLSKRPPAQPFSTVSTATTILCTPPQNPEPKWDSAAPFSTVFSPGTPPVTLSFKLSAVRILTTFVNSKLGSHHLLSQEISL